MATYNLERKKIGKCLDIVEVPTITIPPLNSETKRIKYLIDSVKNVFFFGFKGIKIK